MKNLKLLLFAFVLLLFAAAPGANAQPTDGGAFSSYLVGTYEKRLGVHTMFQVVNPTRSSLEYVMAFFDTQGNFLACVTGSIRPNGMIEVIEPTDPAGNPIIEKDHCVVKVISHNQGTVKRGIVGFQTKVSFILQENIMIKTMSESVLASVPTYYAQEELDYILSLCP